MTWEYLAVLGGIVLFPLLLSADRNLALVQNKGRVLAVILMVSVPYWIWDVVAIARGHWTFNERYILGIHLAGMPLEEWLFFPVLVFVSIFTWDSALYFHRRKK